MSTRSKISFIQNQESGRGSSPMTRSRSRTVSKCATPSKSTPTKQARGVKSVTPSKVTPTKQIQGEWEYPEYPPNSNTDMFTLEEDAFIIQNIKCNAKVSLGSIVDDLVRDLKRSESSIKERIGYISKLPDHDIIRIVKGAQTNPNMMMHCTENQDGKAKISRIVHVGTNLCSVQKTQKKTLKTKQIDVDNILGKRVLSSVYN